MKTQTPPIPTDSKSAKEHFVANKLNGRHYWRSLDELAETSEFKQLLHDEFLPGASENDGINRRHFIKIMAASFALAGIGLGGCRRPEQRILPYAKQPERTVPGIPVYYATSLPTAKDNIPLVVETHQSRPTKIEGNPHYAPYGGRTNAFAQASILDLYDPDRATKSRKGNKTLSQAEIYDLFQSLYNTHKGNGKSLAFLAEPSTSPTRNRMVAELKKVYPEAIWAEYMPVSYDPSEIATEGIFSGFTNGERLRPIYSFKQAKRILSLDADFLFSEPGTLQYSREYAQKRRAVDADGSIKPEKMSRLYQVESTYSTTGGMADHRLRLASSHIKTFLALITAEFLEQQNLESEWAAQLREAAQKLPETAKGVTLKKWAHECVIDLLEHKGEAVILAGSHQPSEVHQLVYFLNQLLDAPGKTIHYHRLPKRTTPIASISELAEAIKKKQVKTLIVLGGNPAYNAPKDLQFIFTKNTDKTIIRLGYHQDETSSLADYHIATHHYLETWSDGRVYDGSVVPVQPMIYPLFDSISELECIARISGQKEKDPYTLVFNTFKTLVPNATQHDFDRFLHDGVLAQSAFEQVTPEIDIASLKQKWMAFDFSPPTLSANHLEILIQPSNTIYDGRYNNNGWCQELPDPMTKICWDNAICISPHLAHSLGIDPKQNNLLQVSAKATNTLNKGQEKAPIGQLTLGDITIEGPIHIQPGLANYTVVLSMGYGRKNTGRVGEGTGFDIFPLVTSDATHIASGATLKWITKTKSLAGTQDHWSMEGRAIIRETDVEDYKHHPDFVDHLGMEAHSPAIYGSDKKKSLQEKVLNQYRGNSLYETPVFGGKQQWGMSIDLNTCTSCNACVVACQSENNIPVVGKDQVLRGREMHWIRIDRYYSSDSEDTKTVSSDPEVSLQPMACQHCEMAPCESVCPVNATVHDEEGLNTMAYNRCVGTRYCANNCPYKVRRFNFFDWNKRDIDALYKGPIGQKGTLHQNNGLQQMQRNPDVTVRMRGVMEKCTYCVQRIQEAKINQKVKARDTSDVTVPDGVIQTACQQVCPTDSIVFGDVADDKTKVSKLKKSPRDYSVLGYLNTRPRTTYLARLRNPNKKLSIGTKAKKSIAH